MWKIGQEDIPLSLRNLFFKLGSYFELEKRTHALRGILGLGFLDLDPRVKAGPKK